MPSDVFWTGAFTFSGGLVGVLAGYANGSRQSKYQEQQLKLEEKREK